MSFPEVDALNTGRKIEDNTATGVNKAWPTAVFPNSAAFLKKGGIHGQDRSPEQGANRGQGGSHGGVVGSRGERRGERHDGGRRGPRSGLDGGQNSCVPRERRERQRHSRDRRDRRDKGGTRKAVGRDRHRC